jgi:hypothetical protein
MLTPSFKTAVEHGKQITALKQITGIHKAGFRSIMNTK